MERNRCCAEKKKAEYPLADERWGGGAFDGATRMLDLLSLEGSPP